MAIGHTDTFTVDRFACAAFQREGDAAGQGKPRIIKNSQDSILFNAILFFLIATLIFALFDFGEVDETIIACAIGGGLLNVVFQTSYIMALIGVFFFRDKLSRRQIAGIVCGVACVVLMNLKIGPCLVI